jgi:hypothetical protein
MKSHRRSVSLALLACAMLCAARTRADIPIWIELEKPQLVTVVIESEVGVRVRNLVAELQLPAGRNRLSWDGCDDGEYETPFVQRHDQKSVGSLTRKRVPPGRYRVRGLLIDNDGIQWTQDESRTVRLAAGAYPVRIAYFQLDGGKALTLRWRGPGVADQAISAEAFRHQP